MNSFPHRRPLEQGSKQPRYPHVTYLHSKVGILTTTSVHPYIALPSIITSTSTMSTPSADRQANLDQTLTSVISLLENEQTLKKVYNLLPTLVLC